MPIFQYACLECNHGFEVLVMTQQTGFEEPTTCPSCHSKTIEKLISAPAIISMDGKNVLRNLPDPHPPLQELKEKGAKEGCEGGYSDLEEWTKPVRKGKDKFGNTLWGDQKKQYFDLGKK